ncbi:MAG: DUF177 domain-containing protein [Anaerolineaceae bacterium]|nr:DUF177 domain-containing protein [Anaerolineaceae bacterium]
MSQLRHPLRLNVGFLVNQPIGTSREFHFDFTSIHLQPDLDLNKLAGSVKISRTPQGLLVQAKFQAEIDAECVRCLIEFAHPLAIDFDELYAFTPRSVSESGLILPEDAHIDLEPLVREYLLIEIPISPLCKLECKGLCPVCGEDLNEHLCEHASSEKV